MITFKMCIRDRYYYATVRDNLASRAATTSDTFRKYFTDTYDQFYTQARCV